MTVRNQILVSNQNIFEDSRPVGGMTLATDRKPAENGVAGIGELALEVLENLVTQIKPRVVENGIILDTGNMHCLLSIAAPAHMKHHKQHR